MTQLRLLILSACLATAASAATAQDCFADYKAKQNNPLRLHYGVAKVQFTDGSWTFVELTSDMTEADLDDIVHRITPPHLKTGATPSFLSAGATRTAAEKPNPGDISARALFIGARPRFNTS